MKILITGGAGFVGSNISNHLHEKHDVTAVDNLRYGNRANLFTSVRCEFRDFQIITKDELSVYDVLIHLATINLIASSENPKDTYRTNAIDTMDLFDKFQGKIIYTSTASVYGNQSNQPLTEQSDIKVRNAYDSSKYIAERYLRMRGNFTTLRLSNVYGINQRPNSPYCGVVGRFIDAGLSGLPMVIYANDTRDYTYISDVVAAVDQAVKLPSINTEVNISTGVETSISHMACTISDLLDVPLLIEKMQQRDIDGIKRRVLSNEKAFHELVWRPVIDLKEGLLKTIEWQKNTL